VSVRRVEADQYATKAEGGTFYILEAVRVPVINIHHSFLPAFPEESHTPARPSAACRTV
jgi:hypothetical protein